MQVPENSGKVGLCNLKEMTLFVFIFVANFCRY